MIRNLSFALAVASIALSAPASADRVLKSTAIGAGAGAVAGAVIPGVSVGTGALLGAGTGAVLGIAKKNRDRRHYYNQNGRSYWVDSHGRRHYR